MYKAPYTINYDNRKTDTSVNSLFTERWSPRSFKKQALDPKDVTAIFEAARWSPSVYNLQPWRIFASSNPQEFDTFLSLLVPMNQGWAKNASVLGFIIADIKAENAHGKYSDHHVAYYDCGFAWAAITTQARLLGLYTHGMVGIEYDKIYEHFNLSKERYTVLAAFAIGVLDNKELLSEQFKEKEQPSVRKPLNEVYFPGGSKNLP